MSIKSSVSLESEESDADFMAADMEFLTKSGAEIIFDLQEKYGLESITREASESSFDKNDPMKLEAKSTVFQNPRKGLSKNFAAIYIIASFCGNGVTYLPYALKLSGFIGYLMYILVGINSLYCGLLIGWCRIIIQEQCPEFKKNIPSPYPKIGLLAAGKRMEFIVTIVMNLAIIIWSTVLASNIACVLDDITSQKLRFCLMLVITAVILVPFAMLGSLKDLWLIVIINTLEMGFFVLILITAIFIDKENLGRVDYTEQIKTQNLATAFGMITFITSSGGTYPSIHDEMINRKLYTQSLVLGYIVTSVMYSPLPLIGYAAYGKDVQYNILHNLRESKNMFYLIYFLYGLYFIKMIATFLVTLNPLLKNMESHLKVPFHFGYRRCIFRTCVMVVILLLTLSFQPNILILEVIGAALLNILAFQFPVIFYICLVLKKTSKKRQRTISKKEWCLLIEILLVSNFGGITAVLKDGLTLSQTNKLFYSSCFTSFSTLSNRTCVYC